MNEYGTLKISVMLHSAPGHVVEHSLLQRRNISLSEAKIKAATWCKLNSSLAETRMLGFRWQPDPYVFGLDELGL